MKFFGIIIFITIFVTLNTTILNEADQVKSKLRGDILVQVQRPFYASHSCVERDLPNFLLHKTFCMLNTNGQLKNNLQAVNTIKKLHSKAHKTRVIRLYKRSFGQLVEDFIVEMDAKNQAYYFILQSGYYEQFREYCNNNPRQKA